MFKAYEDWADEPLTFSIKSKDYTAPEIGIDAGLRIAGVFAGTDKSLDDKPIGDLFELVLGPVWDEMRADGVPYAAAWRAGMAALTYHQEGRDAAEAVWESGLNPEALAAFLAAKRISSSPDSTPSPSTESESETPSPASSTPTTSPRTTQPGKRRATRTKPSPSPGPN